MMKKNLLLLCGCLISGATCAAPAASAKTTMSDEPFKCTTTDGRVLYTTPGVGLSGSSCEDNRDFRNKRAAPEIIKKQEAPVHRIDLHAERLKQMADEEEEEKARLKAEEEKSAKTKVKKEEQKQEVAKVPETKSVTEIPVPKKEPIAKTEETAKVVTPVKTVEPVKPTTESAKTETPAEKNIEKPKNVESDGKKTKTTNELPAFFK